MQPHLQLPQQQHTFRSVSLPPEVWTLVFRYATEVPGTLLPDIYEHSSFVGSDPYITRVHADLREALVTKRSLVLVCKDWWHYAIRFLYESVYVVQKRFLLSLSETLEDSAAKQGTLVSRKPLGEYTQRFDAAVLGYRWGRNIESEYFTTIIKHMPNLAIALFVPPPNHCGSYHVSNDIFDALHHCASSLRVFDWHADPVRPWDVRVAALLAKCTQLRVLNYRNLIWSKALKPDDIPATVTTLRMQCAKPLIPLDEILDNTNLNIAQRFRCPALRELVLEIYPLVHQWQDIFRLYGPKLHSAHLYVYTHVENPLKLLGQTSPELRRLTITSEFSIGPPMNFVLRSVTHLGLILSLWKSTTPNFQHFFTALERFTAKMPALQVVQFLEEDNVKCLLESHAEFAATALRTYETARFRIEDKQGVLVIDRLKALGHL